MRAPARLRSLWRNLVHPTRVDRDLDDELAAAFDEATDERVRAGLDPAEARRLTNLELGRADAIKTHVREIRAGAGVESLWQDVRFGARVLRRTPSFAAAAIVSVALGVGATSTLFGLLNAVRLKPLPVARPYELAEIRLAGDRCCRHTGRNRQVSLPLWQEISKRQQAFSALFAFNDTRFNLAPRGEVRYVEGLYVSGDFFSALGISPLVGRAIEPADDRPGCTAAPAVISHALWQREFAGRPDILTRTVFARGAEHPIAGVMPPGFFGVEVGRRVDVAMPLCASTFDRRDHWWLAVMGRLKPGWTPELADAHLATLGPSLLEASIPAGYSAQQTRDFTSLRFSVRPSANGISPLRDQYAEALRLLLAIAALVLLTACANVANLSLVRAAARQPELALRAALGATRFRIVRQLAVEGVLVAALGAAAGLVLARIAADAVLTVLSTRTDPIVLDLTTDWRIIAFTTAVVSVATLAFAIAPVFRVRAGIARAAARITPGRASTVARECLVALQVAMSVVLVSGALLFVSTFRNLVTMDTGFAWDRILVANVFFADDLPVPARAPLQREVARRMAAIPGVEGVAHATTPPFGGTARGAMVRVDAGAVSGSRETILNQISAGYFGVMETPLVAGRDFDDRDTPGSVLVGIVNERFARVFFNGASPIGRRFYDGDHAFEIIGVVRDSKQYMLREEFRPIIYTASSQVDDPGLTTRYVLRVGRTDATTSRSVRDAVLAAAPSASARFATGPEMITDAMLRERLVAGFAGFFGIVALALASVGVYGVVAYTAATRRREIGIRRALGARAADVLNSVLGRIGLVMAAGAVAGVALTLAVSTTASSFVYGIDPRDPRMLALVVLTIAVAGVTAVVVPARRALRTDPVSALREE